MTTRLSTLLSLAAALVMCAASSANADPWDGQQKWGVGLHGAALGLESKANPDDKVELAGHGLQARYRINARWEVELSAEKLLSDPDDATASREARTVTVSALVHLTPTKQWAWYLIAGLGATNEHVEYVNAAGANQNVDVEQTHVHLGAGLERRFRRFGIGVELRAVGMAVQDDSDDEMTISPTHGPVPAEQSGAQLNVAATYYF